MRRRPVEPPTEVHRGPVEGVRLFYRRLRTCGSCSTPTSWTLEDVGPLCLDHLAEIGVGVPGEIPTSGAAWVVPSLVATWGRVAGNEPSA